ncbi:MAG: DUF2061 domain-containing protein [Myxococcales bacterium]|nr:DUF2061 domain-containing protein [Myxococcales bacterium]
MESKQRSLMKAMSWRAIAMLITASIGYVFTDSATFAISIGLADSAIKIGAYYLHERTWVGIRFGRESSEAFSTSYRATPQDGRA